MTQDLANLACNVALELDSLRTERLDHKHMVKTHSFIAWFDHEWLRNADHLFRLDTTDLFCFKRAYEKAGRKIEGNDVSGAIEQLKIECIDALQAFYEGKKTFSADAEELDFLFHFMLEVSKEFSATDTSTRVGYRHLAEAEKDFAQISAFLV